jgi:hypothetical protein
VLGPLGSKVCVENAKNSRQRLHCLRLSGRSSGRTLENLGRADLSLRNDKICVVSGNNCRSPAMFTSAQSQGTKMASTVASGEKI